MAPLRTHLPLAVAVVALALTLAGMVPAEATTGWRYPVDGVPYVLRAFDPPDEPWLAGHRGVDLAVGAFDPVFTAAKGTVTFAGVIDGQGVVTVTHGELRSTYEPVEASVDVGDDVAAGDQVGWLEPVTSHCGRTCLHWGVLRGDTYVDPMSLVDRPAPALLPLGPPVPVPLVPLVASGVLAFTGVAEPAVTYWAELTAGGAPVTCSSVLVGASRC